MTTSTNSALFDLIKSLSKTEKRYFKVYASRHTIGEENNYSILFDFISKLDEYDETSIFKAFKGEALLNKFSITKKRLYDYVLKALDAFHANSSHEANLYKMIHSAEILYKKALYKQCWKILKSAESLALKQEKFHILLEIQLKFKRLIENDGYSEVIPGEIDEILKNDMNYIDIIQNYSQLWNVKSLLFTRLNKKGVARSEEDKATYKSIVQPLETIKTNDDFDSRYLKHHTLSAYYFAIDDTSSSLKEIHQNIELFQENPSVIEAEPNVYFSTLTNAIYSHNSNGEYKEAEHYLSLLKMLPSQLESATNEDLDIKLFSSINSIELNLLNFRGDFAKAVELEHIIEEGYRLYGHKINKIRRAYLGFSLSVAFFGIENYSSALKWINNILNDSELDHKEDIFCFAQLFNLIIHFELDHKQLLPYAIKNTQRYLKLRNRVYGFETVFLKYITKINKSPSQINQLDLLAEVANELNELRNDPFEKNVFNYFDFATWAQSRVEEIPYATLVKRHFQERSK